jgi:hypothetical protein
MTTNLTSNNTSRIRPGGNLSERTFAQKWRDAFRRRRQRHDPLLAFNMSIFNDNDGWSRIFDPVKAREN